MAVDFSGSGQYWSAPWDDPGTPLTLACWANPDSATVYGVMLCAGTTTQEQSVGAAGTIGGDPIYVLTQAGSSFAAFGGTYSVGTWHHCGGVFYFTGTPRRRAYLDGSSVGTQTSTNVAAIDTIRIGRSTRTSGPHFNGQVGECAIWAGELTDADFGLLAAGVSPLRIRPTELLDYWPMRSGNDFVSIAGRRTQLAPVGAPQTVEHPDVELPPVVRIRRRLYLIPKAAAGVNLIPASLSHAHALDALPWIAQVHQLAPPDVAHGHALDATTVTETHSLTPAEVSHGHALDAATVVQTHALSPSDVAHAHALDAGVLVQTHTLSPADAGHGHALDATTVSQAPQVSPADVAHGHALDAPAVTQTHQLLSGDVGHAQALDAAALTVTHILQAAGIDHAHALDATTATPTQLLIAAEIAHAHALESPGVTQTHVIVVSDVLHAHLLDAATVTGGVEVVVTPLGSVIYVHADPAVIVVAADPTTITVH